MKKRGERILGPYAERAGFRVVEIDAAGNRSPIVFPTEAKATRYIEMMRAELTKVEHTTESALAEYKRYLADKMSYKPQSVRAIAWAIEMMFPEPISLALLTPKRAEDLYESLRTTPNKYTKKPPSADTQKNALIRVRVFMEWCAGKPNYWIKESPFADVKGFGKRRPRGKSLGKSGNELRIKPARQWYGKALELADGGDEGATAALIALLLGMRASEIVSRVVADLDEDGAPGDVLWIPCSKTPAGKRTLEVPAILQPLLVRACEGKTAERYMFEGAHGKPHRPQWIIRQVHRICDLVEVPRVTAHAMRGLLATLTAERGLAGHLIAATLGHENVSTTMNNYAAPGSAAAGARARGWAVLNGGA